jgi:hypothetical protein
VRHPPSARSPPTGHVPYVVAKASKAAPPPSANLYASAPAPTSAPRLPHAGVASFERVGAGMRAQSFPRANAPSAPRRRLFFRQREAAHCVAPPPSLGVLHVRRALERGCGFGRARPLLGSEALLRPSATRNEVLRRLLLVLVVMQGSMRTLASAAQTEEEGAAEASASKMVHGHGDGELTRRPSGVSSSASGWTRASDVPWGASQRVPLPEKYQLMSHQLMMRLLRA